VGYAVSAQLTEGNTVQDVTVIGIDLGKRSFHLHGQAKSGKAVFRKKVATAVDRFSK
jgi:hypothetical protein